jgi:phosphoribosyl 1,2-cyclic phosphodiesterase
VPAFAARYDIPVWLTFGTLMVRATGSTGGAGVRLRQPRRLRDRRPLVRPFPVPHDAREPVQFVVSDGAFRLGVLTDIGGSTPFVESSLSGCDALVLECNHDLDLLADSDYRSRSSSAFAAASGTCTTKAAAALLAALDTSRLQHIVAAHLSQQNNTPAKARAALAGALRCAEDWIGIADQAFGFEWRASS